MVYVSPAQRHDGRDGEILDRRHALYLQARERNLRRWSHHSRNWSRITVVTLDPERDVLAAKAVGDANTQQRAA